MKKRIILDKVFGYREVTIDISKQATVSGYMKRFGVRTKGYAEHGNGMRNPLTPETRPCSIHNDKPSNLLKEF